VEAHQQLEGQGFECEFGGVVGIPQFERHSSSEAERPGIDF
jgi:hypothetical protein